MSRGGKRRGAGRPKGSALPPENRKNNRILIRFNDRQLARIKQAAELEEIPYTVFVRKWALNAANNLLEHENAL